MDQSVQNAKRLNRIVLMLCKLNDSSFDQITVWVLNYDVTETER